MRLQELFVPLVEKLGYEYSNADSADTSLLRTLAISQAALAGNEGCVFFPRPLIDRL
jgi:aminopeptidase 2